ncbi:CobW family GTP-binding protein [Aureimonas endophytica]|uniref:CobW family GTP-binding protein n=1 Tax=Aureimonas endophytica TaxID=2027858 RepID=UPI0016691C76|nr:GTP-binding protein [Aureimonas endophytica]
MTAPIRVSVLTGFLGAGKTTLLNRLLADPAAAGTAVIVNEFGEIGIDHLLVETAKDGLIELSGGCLCCTVRGDLADTLADLVDRIQTGRLAPLRRVVIETTGLAEPAPILAMLMGHPALVQAYALDGVVTVVDALNGAANLKAHVEARRQAAIADRLVLTKTDIASAEATDGLRRALRVLNPRSRMVDAGQGEAGAEVLLDCGLYDPETRRADVRRWLQAEEAEDHAACGDGHHHHHDHHTHHGHAHRHGPDGIASVAIEHRAPLPEAAIFEFLDILAATQGERLLRLKAIVRTREHPNQPLVLHGVRGYLHPPARLAAWPADLEPSTRLVVIGDGLDTTYLRDLFGAFAGEARLDAPDQTALTDNPLAIPGFRAR